MITWKAESITCTGAVVVMRIFNKVVGGME